MFLILLTTANGVYYYVCPQISVSRTVIISDKVFHPCGDYNQSIICLSITKLSRCHGVFYRFPFT